MKLYVKVLLCIFAVIVASGCSEHMRIIDNVDITENIFFTEIPLSDELLMPARMFVSQDRLWILHHESDTLFTVFDMNQEMDVLRVGYKGRGPDEFLNIDVRSICVDDRGFICMDAGGVCKSVTLKNDHIVITGRRNFSLNGYPQNGIFTSRGYLAMNVGEEDSEFILYDTLSSVAVGKYPLWSSDESVPNPFLYIKQMACSPSGDKVAIFYSYFRRFRVLDAGGNLISEYDVRIPDEFLVERPGQPDAKLAYVSYPFADSEYIYAMCHNSAMGMTDVFPEIHLFDWKGNMKIRILTDRPIDLFTIDKKRGRLYGIDLEAADVLYVADLSALHF